jgi:cullin 3
MIRDVWLLISLTWVQYMDRTYIAQQNKTPVFQLGLELWKQHVVHHPVISRRMLNILLDLINKERSGEVIDRGLVRSTTQVRWGNSASGFIG